MFSNKIHFKQNQPILNNLTLPKFEKVFMHKKINLKEQKQRRTKKGVVIVTPLLVGRNGVVFLPSLFSMAYWYV